jgi:hypothetical protein
MKVGDIGVNVASMVEKKYRSVVKKSEAERPLGRPRRRWEDNFKIDVKQNWMTSTGFVWLKVGTGGGLL